jgi:NADPH:quinone reductase
MAVAPIGMRLVNLGQSAGASMDLTSATVRGKRLEIIGHSVFTADKADLSNAHRRMIEHIRAGRLKVDVQTYPLERAAEAWERQRSGPDAKIVVEP